VGLEKSFFLFQISYVVQYNNNLKIQLHFFAKTDTFISMGTLG